MKICYVIVNCKLAGPMNQTLNIIRYLDREKFQPVFVTLFPEEKENTMFSRYEEECPYAGCLGLSTGSSLVYGKQRLRKKLEEIRPDVIHAVGMPAYRLALGYGGARRIVTMRNYMYEDYPSHYNKVIGKPLAFLDMNLLRRRQKKGDTFIACSESLVKIYREKEGISLPCIRNAVDTEHFPRKQEGEEQKLREKLGLPAGKKIFVYTGSFHERKNQEEAIQGFLGSRAGEKAMLILCGARGNYEEVKAKYSGQENILFTGRVSNISEYLRAADYYLSTSRSEGMPNGVLEAMASGIGVILSDIPQHREVYEADERIGTLYRLGDLKDLSEKIDRMNGEDGREYGEHSARIVAECFSAKAMSMKYQEVYESVGDCHKVTKRN